jgi:hypothetical protein
MSKCPEGFKDTGLFCQPNTRNIGIGKPMNCQKTARGLCHTERPWVCSDGKDKIDGLCYNKCDDGTPEHRGDVHVPGMPYLCRKTCLEYDKKGKCTKKISGLLVQEKMKIGVCDKDKDRVGAQCFKKCSDYGPGWVRTVEGTCAAKQWGGIDFLLTSNYGEKMNYARKPLGISYKVFPKKRKIPFGKGPKGC